MNHAAFGLIVAGLWLPALLAAQWMQPEPPPPTTMRAEAPAPLPVLNDAAAPVLSGSSRAATPRRPVPADPIDRFDPGASEAPAAESRWGRYGETLGRAE